MYEQVVSLLRSTYLWPLDCAPEPQALAEATGEPEILAGLLDAYCRAGAANGVQTGTTPLVSDCNGATQFIVYNTITQFDKRVLLDKITEWTALDEADDKAAAKAAWDAKTQAQKDAICVSLGLSAGCVAF
jgi:hypothetical protein